MSTESNKAIVRAFVEAWNTKNLDRFDELMAESAQLTVGGSTISCSPTATREIAEHWFTGFPDYQFELVHLIAEGDKVAALMPFSGTHTGPRARYSADWKVRARERDGHLPNRGRQGCRSLGRVG
jgi:C-1 hydroxylase